MSKSFISYNLIKLLEQSLHAQNAMWLHVLCLIFEVLCVIHREPAGGGGGGREQRKEGGLTATASDWLVLGGSFYLFAHIILKKSCNLPVSLAEQLGNYVLFS